jgi:hypothetical protein
MCICGNLKQLQRLHKQTSRIPNQPVLNSFYQTPLLGTPVPQHHWVAAVQRCAQSHYFVIDYKIIIQGHVHHITTQALARHKRPQNASKVLSHYLLDNRHIHSISLPVLRFTHNRTQVQLPMPLRLQLSVTKRKCTPQQTSVATQVLCMPWAPRHRASAIVTIRRNRPLGEGP